MLWGSPWPRSGHLNVPLLIGDIREAKVDDSGNGRAIIVIKNEYVWRFDVSVYNTYPNLEHSTHGSLITLSMYGLDCVRNLVAYLKAPKNWQRPRGF